MSDFPRIGSAIIVFNEKGDILLGRRNKDPQREKWVIPGGKILAFESISDAAVRELLEETGIAARVGGRLGIFELINPPDEHRIVLYSWGRVIAGELKAGDDLSEVAFFSLRAALDQPLSDFVRDVLVSTSPLLEKLPKSFS